MSGVDTRTSREFRWPPTGRRRWLAMLAVVVVSPITAAEAQPPARPEARAVRVADGAIRVDGTLDEAIWRTAAPVTDFIQA